MLDESPPQPAAEDERPAIGVPAAGWDRAAVTLRLTEERKRTLLALLPEGDPSEGPTAAIDRALSMASAALGIDAPAAREPRDGPAAAAEVTNLADEVQRLADQTREAMGMLESIQASMAPLLSGLAAVAADVADLRGAISAAAALGGRHGDGFEEPPALVAEAMPIKTWLDRSARPPCSWLVADARVRERRLDGSGRPTWVMDTRLVGGDGLGRLSNMPVAVVLLCAAPVAAAPIGDGASLVLDCRRAATGWSVAARSVDASGKLGEELARWDVQ